MRFGFTACGSTEETQTLRVAMECAYAPFNWMQSDDSNGAVSISGSSDYAYGDDVMMAIELADQMGYELEVDIDKFVVNKLLDRGSLSATTIVTNVQDFITIVAKGLDVF